MNTGTFHMVSPVALALEPINTFPNGDWEEGICPNHPQNNQAKLFPLFACHGYIKGCVCCAIICILSNR